MTSRRSVPNGQATFRAAARMALTACLSLSSCRHDTGPTAERATPEAATSTSPPAAASSTSPTPSPAPSARASSTAPDRELVARIGKIVARHHLTKLSSKELTFEIADDPEPGYRLVDVRERHAAGTADPSAAPRLFSFRLNVATGALSTDALSDVGEFEPLNE